MKQTDVIRRPLITEKTTLLREDGRTLVFEVAPQVRSMFPGDMTEHVHLEILDRKGRRIDATRVLTAELEPVQVAAD